MRASHNRALIAARAGATSSTRPIGTPGTDLRARVTSTPLRDGASRSTKRSKGRGLGKSMRAGDGSRSAWQRSPYYFTDPAWSLTVGDLS